ncbi:hypothetical protein GOODEAATRI_002133 [Goodea atripinnis]|uniref:Uncharacterized protein n=1 Tax=Goodea atripinnis TaxID=208336 RepID=A0ABV0NR75_9TELE
MLTVTQLQIGVEKSVRSKILQIAENDVCTTRTVETCSVINLNICCLSKTKQPYGNVVSYVHLWGIFQTEPSNFTASLCHHFINLLLYASLLQFFHHRAQATEINKAVCLNL